MPRPQACALACRRRRRLPAAQVRVGVSIHHSVQSVALDTLVAHRLGGDAVKVGAGGVGWRLRARWVAGLCLASPPRGAALGLGRQHA